MLKSLTSFRFIAALMVYLTHSVGFFRNYQFGAIGVSFFFVLSGFILSYNYHSKFKELNKENIKKFYIARLAKVYPVCLLTLAMSIPYVLFFKHITMTEFYGGLLFNILMIQSFIPLPFGTAPHLFNSVSWSLSDEIFFYLMFPFLICLFLKLKVNIRFVVLFFMVILGIATLSAFFREVKTDADWYFYIFPVFRSLDFIMGILMGLIFVSKSRKNLVVKKALFNFLEIFALVLFIGWIALSPYISQVFRFSIYFVPMWCALIYIFAFQGGIVSKILSHKWLVFLGEISFSFYMVHLLVINYVGLIPMGSLINHIITLFGSILLSAAIYLMYEEPLRKRIRFGAKTKEDLQQENVPTIVIKV